jgi:hypothetical protein
MIPKSCGQIRFWLVAPLLAVGLLFGLNAVYAQPGRPRLPVPPNTQPQNPGGLPGGVTPIGPGFPGGFQGGGAPQPGIPQQGNPPLGIPPNPGFPGQPNPGFPGVVPPNQGLPGNPAFPGPGNPGLPGNGGHRQTGTCTCSSCKATFPVYDNVNPTNCARCGAKFDFVIGGNPFSPQPGIGSQPPIPTPPPMNPPGFPGGNPGGPQFGPNNFQPNNPIPISHPAVNPADADDGEDYSSVIVICATVGIIVLGVFMVVGVVVFVMIIQRIQAADSAAPRRRPLRRRRRDFDA